MRWTPAVALLLGNALAQSPEIEKRQSCPSVHIFGARETTASPGYGSSSTVVNLILNAYPGSTAQAISYPACGGQASCGGASYSASVAAGIDAVASAVNSFNTQCPSTKLVLVGYSQVIFLYPFRVVCDRDWTNERHIHREGRSLTPHSVAAAFQIRESPTRRSVSHPPR